MPKGNHECELDAYRLRHFKGISTWYILCCNDYYLRIVLYYVFGTWTVTVSIVFDFDSKSQLIMLVPRAFSQLETCKALVFLSILMILV